MERIKDGKVYVESSGKYRTPREILTDGEPARLRVTANQLREARVTNEIAIALAVAVQTKDFGLIDKARNLFDQFVGAEKRVAALIADAEKAVAPHRPKVEVAETKTA